MNISVNPTFYSSRLRSSTIKKSLLGSLLKVVFQTVYSKALNITIFQFNKHNTRMSARAWADGAF